MNKIIYIVRLTKSPYIHELPIVRETAKQWYLARRCDVADYVLVLRKEIGNNVFDTREEALAFAKKLAAERLRSSELLVEKDRKVIEALNKIG